MPDHIWLLSVTLQNFFLLTVVHDDTPRPACHCKKERVVLTNFGNLSCTQHSCKPLRGVKNVSAHKLNHPPGKGPLAY